ncbi:MAG: cyclic nucleotide-binding domain-containing protein [Desulfobacterales bacterium]|nr:cyclic nucleotide-binding domain-containing protein [Desulfobacterales bacterium]
MFKKNKEKNPPSQAPSIIDFLIDLPLFDALQGNELTVIARHMNYFELEPGELLFREGDKGDSVCFVVEGALDIYKESAGGGDVVIATIAKRRSIGEMAIIDNTPRSATVKARTATALVSLTQKGFEQVLEEHPKIGITILKGLSRLLSMNLRKTSSRLADYLLPLG